jgi:hypothetical protein
MSYIYDLTDTWNNVATTFTAVKMNVTDTASAAGSMLIDLQVAGASKFSVTKAGVGALTGALSLGGSLTLNAAANAIWSNADNTHYFSTFAIGATPSLYTTYDGSNIDVLSSAGVRDSVGDYRVGGLGVTRILWKLIGADMNSTADQPFTKVGVFTSYVTLNCRVTNSSAAASTAIGGIYTGASKTGISLISAGTGYTGITGASQGQGVGVSNGAGAGVLTDTPILSLTTPQGSAATVDYYILGETLS